MPHTSYELSFFTNSFMRLNRLRSSFGFRNHNFIEKLWGVSLNVQKLAHCALFSLKVIG